MPDGGPVDASGSDVTAIDVLTGPVALACLDGGATVVSPPSTFGPMVIDGLEWPLSGSIAQVADQSLDVEFLQMLQRAGINTMSLFVWYSAYQAHQARYDAIVTAARSAGLKVRVFIKPEIKSLLFGLTPTFPNPTTTFQEFSSTAMSIETELAGRYTPDMFTVVEEFGTTESYAGGSADMQGSRRRAGSLSSASS